MIFLYELVEKNITIIRSKQTNVITNAEKAKVWKEITDSVNARTGGQKKISRPNQGKVEEIRVITKLPNTEQSSKGKGKTHQSTNRQNQSTTGKLGKPQ